MTVSQKDLEHLARLSYLETQEETKPQLAEEITSIMNFIEQLRRVDTKEVTPLFHPLDLHQRLRSDIVTEADCMAELEAIAPQFEDSLYLVPNVMDSGN